MYFVHSHLKKFILVYLYQTEWFSRWLLGLFYKGKKKGLQPEDIYDVLDGLESDQLGERLERFVFLKLVNLSTLTCMHIWSDLSQ